MNDNEMKVELYEVEVSRCFLDASLTGVTYSITYFVNDEVVVIKKCRELLTVAERNLINSKFLVSSYVSAGSFACRRYCRDVISKFIIHVFCNGIGFERIYNNLGVLVSDVKVSLVDGHLVSEEQEISEQEETTEEVLAEQEEYNNYVDATDQYVDATDQYKDKDVSIILDGINSGFLKIYQSTDISKFPVLMSDEDIPI